MFAKIVPFASAGYLDVLTYSVPDRLQKLVFAGVLVEIAVKGKRVKAIVIETTEEKPDFETKPLEVVLSEKIVQEIHLQFWEKCKNQFFSSFAAFSPFFVPFFVRQKNGKIPQKNALILKKFPEKTTKKWEKTLFSFFEQVGEVHSKQMLLEIPAKVRKEAVEKGFLEEISIENFSVQKAEKPYHHSHSTVLAIGKKNSEKENFEMEKILQEISLGNQVLVLFPENLSIASVFEKYAEKCGAENIEIFHAKKTDSHKENVFWSVQSGKTKIVLGTMSAAFLPFVRLGLILVFDFFDASYHMPLPPFFSGTQTAKILAQHWNAKLILSSYTASTEEIFGTEEKKIVLFPEIKNPSECEKTNVMVVNLETEMHNGNGSLLPSVAENLTKEALERGEQAFFFLNRRGAHTAVVCKKCGYIPRSPFSGQPLQVHLQSTGKKFLKCTQSGHTQEFPKMCPACKGEIFAEMGKGTQLLEEILQQKFPEKRIVRLDKDMHQNFAQAEELMQEIAEKKVDIVIGTQMMLKSFDFPFVSVAVMVLVENDLCFPDFRAEERVFQNIHALKNQLGKNATKKTVVLQSFAVSLPIFSFVEEEKMLDFFKKEYSIRKNLFLPPFSVFAKIFLKGKDKEKLFITAQKLLLEMEKWGENLRKKQKIFPPIIHFEKLRNAFVAEISVFLEDKILLEKISSKVDSINIVC